MRLKLKNPNIQLTVLSLLALFLSNAVAADELKDAKSVTQKAVEEQGVNKEVIEEVGNTQKDKKADKLDTRKTQISSASSSEEEKSEDTKEERPAIFTMPGAAKKNTDD